MTMKGPSAANVSQLIEPDFSEYMWMAEELDDFDNKVNAELERDYAEYCEISDELDDGFSADDEEGEWFYAEDYEKWKAFQPVGFEQHNPINWQLNPYAAEFVPRFFQSASSFEQER